MDLSQVSFESAQQWLDKEGYKAHNSTCCAGAANVGDYCLLYVTEPEDSQYYRDSEYVVSYYKDLDTMLNMVGILFCGGNYTAIGIFNKGKPISKETIRNISFMVPVGSTESPYY